jgi:hypothetical protein
MLEDGSSWLELFSSIQVGAKMAHNHTFVCPVFALQNKLAAGNTIPKWSPRACLGLNLGPSPMHARNVYLILNLCTGLVSPQYHCYFDDFFATTKYGGTDVTISSTWQQLAGLNCATEVFSQNQTSTLHSHMQTETPADTLVPSEQLDASMEHQDVNWEFYHDITGETIGVATPQDEPPRNQGTRKSEGALQESSTNTSAGISKHGRVRSMSRKMADSMSQCKFYGNAQMHYMALEAIMGETPVDIFYNLHLELQELMRNPVAFHAEMMGDIMYLHQALKQKDASQFVDAVVQEINGHVDNELWDLVKRDSVPNNVQIVLSVWSLWHKRNLTTNKITKPKARLKLHGGKQVYDMNYYETYAPVVTWFAIRLMIIFGILFQFSQAS